MWIHVNTEIVVCAPLLKNFFQDGCFSDFMWVFSVLVKGISLFVVGLGETPGTRLSWYIPIAAAGKTNSGKSWFLKSAGGARPGADCSDGY